MIDADRLGYAQRFIFGCLKDEFAKSLRKIQKYGDVDVEQVAKIAMDDLENHGYVWEDWPKEAGKTVFTKKFYALYNFILDYLLHLPDSEGGGIEHPALAGELEDYAKSGLWQDETEELKDWVLSKEEESKVLNIVKSDLKESLGKVFKMKDGHVTEHIINVNLWQLFLDLFPPTVRDSRKLDRDIVIESVFEGGE